MCNLSKIIVSVFLIILNFSAFSQEIGKRFSVSANCVYSFNRMFGSSFPNGWVSIGYNVNNFVKPFIGFEFYTANNKFSNSGAIALNKVDIDMGLEGRFFKTNVCNLVLQTKFGTDIYSNARNKPVRNLRVQDKFYVYTGVDQINDMKVSDGIYRHSLFWSNSLLLSIYFKSFEVKLGPGYQLGVFKFKKGTIDKHILHSYSGTISLTYYFKR